MKQTFTKRLLAVAHGGTAIALAMVSVVGMSVESYAQSAAAKEKDVVATLSRIYPDGRTEKVDMPTRRMLTPVSGTMAREGEQTTHAVDFKLDYNPECERVDNIILYSDVASYYLSDLGLYASDIKPGSNVVNVPEGEYLVMTTFAEFYPPNAYPVRKLKQVFLDNVKIDKEIELGIGSAEAKNHVAFRQLLPDGEPVYTGLAERNPETNETVILEEGNIVNCYYFTQIIHDKYGLLVLDTDNFGMSEMVDGTVRDCTEFADLWVNDLGEEYGVMSYRVSYDKEGVVYTFNEEARGVSGDVTYENDPAAYALYETPFYSEKYDDYDQFQQITIYPANTPDMVYSYDITFSDKILEPGSKVKVYLGNDLEKCKLDIYPLIQFSSAAVVGEDDWGQPMVDGFLTGMPVANMGGKAFAVNNGVGSLWKYTGPNFRWEYLPGVPEGKEWDRYILPVYPGHPVFSYDASRMKGNIGGNVPLYVTQVSSYGTNVITSYDYMGRFGGKNPQDAKTAYVKFDVNGETVIENYGTGGVNFGDEIPAGAYDVSMTLDNFTIDGLDASNKAAIHFNMPAGDYFPPTMQQMWFVDGEGMITDRFAKASDGAIEFSCADFNDATTPNGYFVYERLLPEKVEVSYAPYGSGSWSGLPVEENPDYFWAWNGYFFRGLLGAVKGNSETGWFDLRFRLEDAAGNWQEQVISPAFKIDELAGVESIAADGVETAEYYTVDGIRLDRPARGLNIVRRSDGTTSKVMIR